MLANGTSLRAATILSVADARQSRYTLYIVHPQLYQRVWFLPAIAGFLVIVVIAACRMYIRRLRSGFDLALAEHTRVAHELQETLLHGLAGVTTQMQAVWTRLPASREKQRLGAIIADAGKCCAQARRSRPR